MLILPPILKKNIVFKHFRKKCQLFQEGTTKTCEVLVLLLLEVNALPSGFIVITLGCCAILSVRRALIFRFEGR